MKALATATAMLMLLVSACGGDTADSPAATAAPETTSPTTTAPATGISAVEACVDQMNELLADVDLDAEDALDEIEAILDNSTPTECAFFDEGGPESIGVSDDDAYAVLVERLDPKLLDLLATPLVVEPFEHTADEL